MNRIARTSLLMAAAAGVGAAVAWTFATRGPHETPQTAPALIDQAQAPATPTAQSLPPVTSGTQQTAAASHQAPQARQPASPETVARWITAATAVDPKTRAAAITALAAAPRSQAIPVLRDVLAVGDPEVDRQLALDSLHVLALEQGDADGKIRKVLREVVYHGDDEAVAKTAQSILEDIESESCLASGQNACDPAN